MRPRARSAVLVAMLTVAVGVSASAQEKLPKRPKLDAGLDTNEARSYLLLAIQKIERQPDVAAAAYYWASRLNPASAQAFYGRAMANIMADGDLLKLWFQGSHDSDDRAELRRIDSLIVMSAMLNPFLHRNLDRKAWNMWADRFLAGPDRAEASYVIDRYLLDAPPAMQAWFAYSDSRFTEALSKYATAIRRARVPGLYALRGEIFFLIGNSDSAIANLTMAIRTQKKIEDTKLVVYYQPKARFEHQVGWVYEWQGRFDEARDAYGRALAEDLSFYPAHVRLAALALARHDTTSALLEFDLATQTGPRDAPLRYQYGYLLAITGELGEASKQVLKAIEIEPYYAEPYAYLGRLYEARDMPDLAASKYKAFLDRASMSDPQRVFVTARLAALRTAPAIPPGGR